MPANWAVVTISGAVIGTVMGFFTWLAEHLGGMLDDPLSIVVRFGILGIGLAVIIVYVRYVIFLGAGGQAEGADERQGYEALRTSLAAGGSTARLYARWLGAFLDWSERFFGDSGQTRRTFWHDRFGLRAASALWTAPAFDRCLLLALIYPIAAIFVVWAITAHVGPAEAALGLRAGAASGSRYWLVGDLAFMGFAGWRLARTSSGSNLVWGLAFLSACAVAVASSDAAILGGAGIVAAAFSGPGAAAVAGAIVGILIFFLAITIAVGLALGGPGAVAFVYAVGIAWAIAVSGAGRVAGIVVVAVAVVIAIAGDAVFGRFDVSVGTGTGGVALALAGAAAVAGAGAVVFVRAAQFLNTTSIKHRRQGMFLAGLEFILTLVCLVAPLALMPLLAWSFCGPLLLFVGLLTLINAPFDFYSLGLTRALLRLGLEREGWWPFVLAFVDAALAALFIIALSIAMVIGVQAFDAIAVHAGGTAVLPLDKLFDGIAMQPAAPEYWWVYALLLTTMVPSAINLMIGGFSLMRGIPWVNVFLLGFMSEGKAVPTVNRAWIALVLTLQMFVGFLLGIVVQIGLVKVVIVWILPAFGAGLLDIARAVVDANVPGVVGRLMVGAGR